MPSDKDKTYTSAEILAMPGVETKKEKELEKILTDEVTEQDYENEQLKDFFNKDDEIEDINFD